MQARVQGAGSKPVGLRLSVIGYWLLGKKLKSPSSLKSFAAASKVKREGRFAPGTRGREQACRLAVISYRLLVISHSAIYKT